MKHLTLIGKFVLAVLGLALIVTGTYLLGAYYVSPLRYGYILCVMTFCVGLLLLDSVQGLRQSIGKFVLGMARFFLGMILVFGGAYLLDGWYINPTRNSCWLCLCMIGFGVVLMEKVFQRPQANDNKKPNEEQGNQGDKP